MGKKTRRRPVMFTNMANSLQSVRETLVFAYFDDIIDEEEFAGLYEENVSREVFPYWKYDRFSFHDMDETECKVEFRFHKADLELLLHILGFPDKFTCSQGTVCTGIEGLCILLKRLFFVGIVTWFSDLVEIQQSCA